MGDEILNTSETLRDKFAKGIDDMPIWYYKELEEVEVDYVIFNLLKTTFVVEIDGSKHEITFGKNRKHEIGQHIRYNDIKNSNLCSFEVINQGFQKGKWFTITDKDTTESFKQDYLKRKVDYEKTQREELYRDLLTSMVEKKYADDKEKRNLLLKDINNFSYEELDYIFNRTSKKEQKYL